ncbi:hypothetical protein KR093_009560 [Drosophila rubida]|uniref:CHHC U11-48K-type domain-containing protein n=1 Tax=Drosophila rubida TaxID=30044 RepID=A0AAD4PLV8_9MUSC|nr:hypothetical protein KR093_009560 [Drosophila rubida]
MAESNSFNDFVTCPYDKSHRLLRGRLPRHLISCSRNLGNLKQWAVCPFNTTHRCEKKELAVSKLNAILIFWALTIVYQEHVKDCPDAAWLKGSAPDAQRSNAVVPQPAVVECDENWDDEPPVPSYNPNKYCEENLIIRSLKGHSKAVRKNFRESERRRLAEKQ